MPNFLGGMGALLETQRQQSPALATDAVNKMIIFEIANVFADLMINAYILNEKLTSAGQVNVSCEYVVVMVASLLRRGHRIGRRWKETLLPINVKI